MNSTEPVRTFIAIELSEELKTQLAEAQTRLKARSPARAVKWVNPEGVHLTIKFLGNVPAERIPAIASAIERAVAGHAAFDIHLAGLGCFPDLNRPRVIWVGVEGDLEALEALQRAVEKELHALGYPPEGRRFTAHLTLGRVRDDAAPEERRRLGEAVRAVVLESGASLTVHQVSLMKSDLQPTGAVYTQLATAQLSGA
jgi:2'-5' RNA ligase